MIRVVLLGFGNVNYHIAKAFKKSKEVTILQIYNRVEKKVPKSLMNVPFITDIAAISKEADCYIVAVPDDVIPSFSEMLPLENKLVVHTSGGVSMELLNDKNRKGVYYPLQSFSKKKKVPFKNIPICIEAENKKDVALLQQLGKAVSKKVVQVSSEKRRTIHLAAVFANNFVNYMYGISEDILKEKKLDFDLLKPLITETANKINRLSPSEAQTGPAKRNDLKTIEKHLHLLADSPHKELYDMLTKAIVHEKL